MSQKPPPCSANQSPANLGRTSHCRKLQQLEYLHLILERRKDPRFQIELYEREEDRPMCILSVPILNHKKEVIGVVLAVNKSRPGTCVGSFFSEQDEKVLSSHMVLFGLILENSQLCESSEQESKRNQVLLELAQLVSHDYPSVDDMLSKLAAVILPVTQAQFCTVFISDDNSMVGPFSKMVHIEHKENDCSVQYSTRDYDSNDISYAYAVHVRNSMEMLNIVNSSEAVIPSADSFRLLDFSFSDFDMSQIAMTQAVVRMFLDLNLPQEFSIDYKILCQWVLSVQKCYRSNVVYHNWSHALRTAQCMFVMLQTKELKGSQILSSLSLKEYRACVQMIEKNILATDLAIYIEKRAKFFKLAQNNSCLWTDEGHRELLGSFNQISFSQEVMDRENSTRLPHMQVAYIDGICSPLYEQRLTSRNMLGLGVSFDPPHAD
ncbi:cGMP-specific 3, 5 -cyclic phosphodiesterase-like isoform X3 [Labeo rohita]|uniref:cGMP-specific 3, 5-cyclic phosphodiesterase-like isoform X3 n=1 Tax=Labeo rohita TaxID=84645 RepID=A0A498MEG5_LABRO|nr:cGMP-specific 3, 5 -cyclic phosphodiesterase-like isoform X3 [Labeo rohita]